jgi:membrane protease YdiL (CAAX protease family)
MLSEKTWKPDAVWRLFLGIMTSLSLGMLFAHWLHLERTGASGNIPTFSVFVVGAVSFHLAAFLLISFFLREHGIGWGTAVGFSTDRLIRTLALSIGAALVVLPVAFFLIQTSAHCMQWFRMKPQAQQAVQLLQNNPAMPWGQKLGFGLVAVGLAPVVEEMLFRGVMYPAIKQLGFPRVAGWVTSLFFALIHFNLMTFVPLTVLAFVLIWLYERTDNLLAPILTHSLFNTTNFIWLLLGSAGAS